MKALLRVFQSGSPSVSSSDTGSASQNQNLNMNEATLMPRGNTRLEILSQHSPRTQEIAQLMVNKMLNNKHFSICDLDTLMSLLNLGTNNAQTYKELRALHCINYADMPANLRNQIPMMINQVLTHEPVLSVGANLALQGVFNSK